MVTTNQWVAIENEDAGDDDEPDQNWYYFQANGKALKNTSDNKVSLKTINGKKYAFDEDGKMLWGWVNEDEAEHIDNSDGNAFMDGVYYFGDADDGAMTTGWIQLDITYDDITDNSEYKGISPVFTEDDDQTRWFYFGSNGKKVHSDSDDEIKERNINGKKYGFDQHGAMVAEWSVDIDRASGNGVQIVSSRNTADNSSKYQTGKYAQQWRYFQSVEDGSKLSRGWFQVVSPEYLNEDKYDDGETAWYWADGSGDIYAGEFKTINGKKYAFGNDGRMLSGLKFILEDDEKDDIAAYSWDDDDWPFDNEDDFLEHAVKDYEPSGYKCYYFGGGEDGAMRTGKTTIELDGENKTFFFAESGSKKGQGITGEEDGKLYQSGLLLAAGTDEKYQVVQYQETYDEKDPDKLVRIGYNKLEDVDAFKNAAGDALETIDLELIGDDVDVASWVLSHKDELGLSDLIDTDALKKLDRDREDLDELYIFNWANADEAEDFVLVNKSGKIVDDDARSIDGEDYVYVTDGKGRIVAIYLES